MANSDDKTVRQRMIDLLVNDSFSARELSQALSISEKDVYTHLAHIERTVKTRCGEMRIDPPVCKSCGFIFRDRGRLTRPGRCPVCKKSHISEAFYNISLNPA